MRHRQLTSPAPKTQNELYSIFMDSPWQRHLDRGLRPLGVSSINELARRVHLYPARILLWNAARNLGTLPDGGGWEQVLTPVEMNTLIREWAGVLSNPILILPEGLRWARDKPAIVASVRSKLTELGYTGETLEGWVAELSLAGHWDGASLWTPTGAEIHRDDRRASFLVEYRRGSRYYNWRATTALSIHVLEV